MSENREEYRARVLQTPCNPATMEVRTPDMIQVSRAELEYEHNHLLARLHQLRKLLGYPVLMTGKQIRKQHE